MGKLKTAPLRAAPGMPWTTADPFLFCVHHRDDYPAGDAKLGVAAASLAGRSMGQDFGGKDGFSMYHGEHVPGFPAHPHRGFETITIVRRGYIDHSDSLGATARIGPGDVQWMTAGRGIVHCEMFPLLQADKRNPVELFQIWLNLPAKNKLVEPYFTMLWAEKIPTRVETTERGSTELMIYAGSVGDIVGPMPPPSSFASDSDAHVTVVTIKMSPGAELHLPAAANSNINRTLYFFTAGNASINDELVGGDTMISLPTSEITIRNGDSAAEFLLLGGRAINEAVAAHGPFVMNTRQEIQQAISDYQRTGFGGWPWPSDSPVHARDRGRFAMHPDGRIDEP
jgi:quercetin 2,3-dioxygenase